MRSGSTRDNEVEIRPVNIPKWTRKLSTKSAIWTFEQNGLSFSFSTGCRWVEPRDEPMEELNPVLSADDPCSPFTNVNMEKQEFHSPGLNGTYPPNIDCYLVLKGRQPTNAIPFELLMLGVFCAAWFKRRLAAKGPS